MESPKDAQTAHVESTVETSERQHGDDMAAGRGSVLTFTGEEIRDQMAAQIKASKLSFTSRASMQMYLILFISYCSMVLTVHRMRFPC
jgi:hypothetical protein